MAVIKAKINACVFACLLLLETSLGVLRSFQTTHNLKVFYELVHLLVIYFIPLYIKIYNHNINEWTCTKFVLDPKYCELNCCVEFWENPTNDVNINTLGKCYFNNTFPELSCKCSQSGIFVIRHENKVSWEKLL